LRKVADSFLLMAFLLAGCAESLPPPSAGGTQVPAVARSGEIPKPKQKPRQQAAAQKKAGSPVAALPPGGGVAGGQPGGAVAALPQGSASAAPAAPPTDPRTLVGMDEQAISRLLGEPTWTEDVPPAKYWQYATQSCVLRVFFFMEMTTRNFRALSYELTSSDDAPNVDEQCFAQLLAQAADRPSSGRRS
jgi:hypothetical protein